MAGKKPFVLTIDRSKWLRGNDSVLLDDDGRMCAIGFLCDRLKIPHDEFRLHAAPDTIVRKNKKYGKRLNHFKVIECVSGAASVTDVANQVMSSNDSRIFSNEEERESRLTGLFKEIGIELKFI